MSQRGARFTDLLGVELPIIQAPMAGGPTTPALVSAVCNAGAFGSIAGASLSPQGIVDEVSAVRTRTTRPFGINLFVLAPPTLDMAQVDRAVALLAPLRERLGLAPWQPPQKYCEDFAAQLEATIACAPRLASFTFGILTRTQVDALHAAGSLVMGTATNIAEARAWQEVGADMVCAQGSEAGGHRGTFIGHCEDSLTGLIALVPQILAAVDLPVVAAGGMMNGAGIAAALTLGAAAAQLGTAFLVTNEANVPAPWRSRLLGAQTDETCVTRAFSGRHARGLRNAFVAEYGKWADEFPAYPVQNALTAEVRAAAAKAQDGDWMSLWAGQGVAMCRAMSAAAMVTTMVSEWHASRSCS